MKFGLVIVAASMLAALAASAEESARNSLSGYDGFRFGMTEPEARSVQPLSSPILEPKRTRFRIAQSKRIDGVDYELSITLMKGKLDTILLSSDTHESDIGCQGNFQRVVSLVQSKYGPPDTTPSNKVLGGVARFEDATFTFKDGNAILLSSVFVKTCLVSVAYTAAKSGGSF